jgi:TRAP-type uncharacterized transport system substrate-binding protein
MTRSRTIWIGAGVAILLIAACVAVLAILRPAPPSRIVMAAGPADSAYFAFGQRYKRILATHGIELQLRETAGSVENLSLLQDSSSGVSVAFVQGGLTSPEQSPQLESLGTMFREPMWIFMRPVQPTPGEIYGDLRNRTLSIGPRGSGSNFLARRLLEELKLTERDVHLVELPQSQARTQLLAGTIDGMVLVAPWESPVVQQLLHDPGIEQRQFPRADAIVALTPYLKKVTLVRGVVDLARDVPATDLTLIAAQGTLVVRRDLHPALQYLLLDAAAQIHSAPSVFNRDGEFPAAQEVDLPLSKQAQQFHLSGRPFLQRYLPFWLAVLVERLLYLLIPIVGVIYPLLRGLPGLYAWSMRARINRLYGELKLLEVDLDRQPKGANLDEFRKRLASLEHHANGIHVPTAYAHLLYTLRVHIQLVRTNLAARGA